jgi:DNA-binding GntR family transcriptional regulator
MDTVASQTAVDAMSGTAIRRRITSQLIADIFQGNLAAGTRLVVMKLAERFHVSSTPVREAMVELEAVGLIQFVHHRGAVVKPFGPNQLQQIYQIRRILETEAARCACGNIDHAGLETLRLEMLELDRNRSGDDWALRAMAADRRLHQLVAAGCGSGRLADEIRRYETLMQTGRDIVGNRRKAQERALEQHLAILDRLLACDSEGAAGQMAHHIESTGRLVETVMFHAGS